MNPTSVLVGLALGLLAAAPPPRWATQARYVMGTTWTVEARAPDAGAAISGAFAEIRRLDRLLSTYRADSEISRVNREAAATWVPVSPETHALLDRALDYSRRSGGAFDPTVGPLVRLWGFKHRDYRLPADAEVAAARASIGHRHVRLDPHLGVRFARAGPELDLGAIAKGYAVDRALASLRASGAIAARVDAGGNQGVFGRSPAGTAWHFGIKHPRVEGEVLEVLHLHAGGISTSGDAERGFWKDGVRYGHILDPATGFPVAGMLGVTVIAPTAEQADALSTTLYVLGVDEGNRLLAGYPGCRALYVQAGSKPGQFELSRGASR